MIKHAIQTIAAGAAMIMLAGCVQQPRQPTNVEVGYNQLCVGVDGVWYAGDPFAPVVNDSACLRHGVQPMFPQ